MFITVTLNPAMDRVVVVEELILGDVNRLRDGRSDPGGKGINVSRVLRELGSGSLAMGFVAGSIGRFVEASLNDIGIADDFIHIPGQTRTNVSLVESRTGRQTSLNEAGPATEPRYVKELHDRLAKRLSAGDWLILAGSVPPGVSKDVYNDLIRLARSKQALTVLDADGEVLARGVAAKPHLIKPNIAELGTLIGRPLVDERDVIATATELHKAGIAYVVVSMAAQGTVAVGPDADHVGQAEIWRGYAPRVDVQSSIGAGDSLVAGLVLGLSKGDSLREALRLGMAAGAATAMTPGTMLCRRADVERLLPEVHLDKLPSGRPLVG